MTQRPTIETLFEFHGGLHLTDSVLWFDAHVPKQLCFISHANVRGHNLHQKILATEHTVDLLRALASAYGRGRRVHEPPALICPYNRPFSIGQLSLELFPSGYTLGAASLFVKFKGVRISYTSGLNTQTRATIKRVEARPCDVLVLYTLYGERRFAFPPLAQTAEALTRFVKDCLERENTPVLFCNPVGEAQEIAQILSSQGICCRMHRQIYYTSRVFQSAGASLGDFRMFSGNVSPEETLLWPIALRESPTLAKVPAQRSALVSGAALDPESQKKAACEAAFAISSHADYPGILEYVRASNPAQVVLPLGASDELKADLQALGIKVSNIGPPQQLDLF